MSSTKKRGPNYEKILPEVAVWTSSKGTPCGRGGAGETDKAKKVQFMEHHIGEEFTGVISGISNYGFYVELPNTVEGMVRLCEPGWRDYYVFDEGTLC